MSARGASQSDGAVRTRGAVAIRELAPAFVLFALAALIVAGLPWPCPLKITTGLPCPSCGLTRAARLALRGDFAGATAMHPLWFVVLPACAAAAIAECVAFARTRAWGTVLERPIAKRAGLAIVALLVAVWIARFFGAFGGPVVG